MKRKIKGIAGISFTQISVSLNCYNQKACCHYLLLEHGDVEWAAHWPPCNDQKPRTVAGSTYDAQQVLVVDSSGLLIH